jgi:preprotein translocase subunit SecE
MAKTLADAADQQGTGLDRAKPRSERGGSGDSGLSNGTAIGGQYERFRTFLTDVRAEMRKVVVPSRDEVQSTTAVVVITVFLFAGYFALVDYVVGQGITQLIGHFTAH